MRNFLIFGLLVATSLKVYGQQGLELDCRIEPHVSVDVSSSAEGVMGEVLVKKNDEVKEGQVLARLEATLEQATAELRKLQSSLDSEIDAQALAFKFAERNLMRVKNLHKKKAASFAELDKAKTEFEIAEQQLRQARDRKNQADLEYKRAIADLERRVITSPISGVVVQRFKEPGEHIYYEPVLQLAQLDPLRVEVYAPAALYTQIKEGMSAVVSPELIIRNKEYNAEVISVDRVIDGPSNTFGVVLSIPNPFMELPSGLKCKVRFSGLVASYGV